MPYKKIEDRRNAWRRWKARNNDEHRKYQRIQAQAIYSHPIRQQCSIKDCSQLGERHHPDYNKPKDIVWLCKYHHELVHTKLHCEKPNCLNKHLARGMCQKHYSAWRRAK